MLRSPHSPPPSAACDSLALVCSSIEPPPQAERASVATAATAPSRAARLRAVLMVVLLIWWWIGTSLGSPVSPASGLADLPVAGEADGQSRVGRPPRPGPVVTTVERPASMVVGEPPLTPSATSLIAAGAAYTTPATIAVKRDGPKRASTGIR